MSVGTASCHVSATSWSYDFSKWKWMVGATSWNLCCLFWSFIFVFTIATSWLSCRWDWIWALFICYYYWFCPAVAGSDSERGKKILLFTTFCMCYLSESQVCTLCSGTVLNGTEVGQFCSTSAGRIYGRCCLRNDNASDPEHIIG